MRILVVEDDAKIASFVIKGLEQSGFAVDHAINGDDGLFLVQTEPYDAAIIDVMLPSVDGLSIVVDVLVCRLRNKVDRGFHPKLIHTIRGVGYVIKGS